MHTSIVKVRLTYCFLFTVAAILLTPSGNAGDYLVKDGASAYEIALDPKASPSEQYAASELQRFIRECSDVEFPIVHRVAPGDKPMIVVGTGNLADTLGVTSPSKNLGEQGYYLKTVPPHIIIAGTREAGTLYGVYDFLEEIFKVRWYAPDTTVTPSIKQLELPIMDVARKPAFLWRHTSYAFPGGDEAFRARIRDNAGPGTAENVYGIQHDHDGRCHSYFWYVSPEEYFDEHPEYFSEIGGLRRRYETQLCLTNPDVLEIVTEKMLERMRSLPNARQHNFSQMDYYNYCECPKCSEINRRYGTLGGTQYWFLNQLAERTFKEFPEKLIGTLAYMYTEEPPKDFVLHPNIAIWLCHMYPCCDSHSIRACPMNSDYRRRAETWAKITSHLYIWHYVVNFAHYYVPFPNFRALAEDLRFYRDIGVEGIFLQGMGDGGGGGEFSVLRPWYIMKLAWDPDQEANALLKDFLTGYYQNAWEPIYNYIAMLHDKVEQENIHMHLYTNPAQGYLSDEIMEKAHQLFDQAEASTGGNDLLLEKVRVARMPLVYAKCFPRNGYRIENEELYFNPPLCSLDEVSQFIHRMKTHGFSTLRERFGDPQQLALLALVFNLPMDAPIITNKSLELQLLPFLGGRIIKITYRSSGQCVTGYNITRNLFFPFCGGEETRLGGMYDLEGSFFQYGILERSEKAITLLADTGTWLIKRQIRLIGEEPALSCSVEVTNITNKPRETILRSHTNLNVGDLNSVEVSFRNRKGENIRRKSESIIAGLREGEYYRELNAPQGAWRFSGNGELAVVQKFSDEQLDFAWAYAYPDYLNDLEIELWAKPVLLEPQQTTAFSFEFYVEPRS